MKEQDTSPPTHWNFTEKSAFRFFFVFVLLFIISFPFPHEYIPDAGTYTSPFFEVLIRWVAGNILHLEKYTCQLISDSTGMYIHAGILLALSALACTVWSITDRRRPGYNRLAYWFAVVVSYYLAMQFFSYGFNKVFKWQFYLPEPNTLYTPVGYTTPDILFWSTMGVSYTYTVFSGVLEVIAALLLLSRPARLAGALMAAGIMLNVVLINFGFDISVKLYSCFLLLLSLVTIIPHAKRLYNFFILNKAVAAPQWKPQYSAKGRKAYIVAKTFVICFLLFDALALYFRTGDFNNDKAPRPLLHGAYDVKTFIKNGDTLPPLLTDSLQWKRVFVHSRGYFITQFMNDDMQDYELMYDTARHRLLIHNYYSGYKTTLAYTLPDSNILLLTGILHTDTLSIRLQKIPLHKLPALQNDFHWTIDSYN